ncbi:hypothetical protein [Delftia sp. Cs1-4]|uniref:hypothetical protein n=1 Tax=Delftia sp. (strain Cs1-4) TaxID=742013 RepID=UPI0012F4BD3C|nr:hypothetical protein [Delftia sp. Cs1-4]
MNMQKKGQAILLQALLDEIRGSGIIYINSKDNSVRRKISEDLKNIQIHLLLSKKPFTPGASRGKMFFFRTCPRMAG